VIIGAFYFIFSSGWSLSFSLTHYLPLFSSLSLYPSLSLSRLESMVLKLNQLMEGNKIKQDLSFSLYRTISLLL
jgi:hypothetical protein